MVTSGGDLCETFMNRADRVMNRVTAGVTTARRWETRETYLCMGARN